MNTLKRLRPRADGQIHAIQLQEWRVSAEPVVMAAKLAQHWEEASQKKCADQVPTLEDVQDWQISVGDVAKAIRRAGSTALGPQGIPHSFWKRIGKLRYTSLCDVLRALMQDGSDEQMVAECRSADDDVGRCDFNGSLLVLIPRKLSGSDAELGPFFKPEDARPSCWWTPPTGSSPAVSMPSWSQLRRRSSAAASGTFCVGDPF